MKRHTYLFLTLFLTTRLWSQADFSKDLLINKTLFKCLDSIQTLKLLPKKDTLFFNDLTLRHTEDYLAKDIGYQRDFTKDTVIKDILLRSTTLSVYSLWPRHKSYRYSLDFVINHIEDQEITVSYKLFKVVYNGGSFTKHEIGPEIQYTVRTKKKLSDCLNDE